jgi:hypothetical protein
MTKTSAIQTENLDRFLQTMSRVLGVSRRRIDKIMFQGQTPPRFKGRSTARRGSIRSSSLLVK